MNGNDMNKEIEVRFMKSGHVPRSNEHGWLLPDCGEPRLATVSASCVFDADAFLATPKVELADA